MVQEKENLTPKIKNELYYRRAKQNIIWQPYHLMNIYKLEHNKL